MFLTINRHGHGGRHEQRRLEGLPKEYRYYVTRFGRTYKAHDIHKTVHDHLHEHLLLSQDDSVFAYRAARSSRVREAMKWVGRICMRFLPRTF